MTLTHFESKIFFCPLDIRYYSRALYKRVLNMRPHALAATWHQSKTSTPFFSFCSPSSPHVAWSCCENNRSCSSFFSQHNRGIKNHVIETAWCCNLHMPLLCLEWSPWNLQQTFANCGQTRLCREMIHIANQSLDPKLSFDPLLSFISISSPIDKVASI